MSKREAIRQLKEIYSSLSETFRYERPYELDKFRELLQELERDIWE